MKDRSSLRARIAALGLSFAIVAGGCGGGEPARKAEPPAETEDAAPASESPAGPRIVDGVLLLALAPQDPPDPPTGTSDRLAACRRAAAAAEDVHLALRGPGWPAVRDTLEQILARPGETPPAISGRIRDFATRFFLWHGTVDPRTGRPVRPRFIPGELAAAAEAASMAGASLPLPETSDPAATRTERLEALLARIRPLLFPLRDREARDAAVPDGEGEAGGVDPGIGRIRESLAAVGVPVAMPPADSRPGQLVTGGLGPDLAVIVGFRDDGEGAGFGALLAVPDPRAAAIAAKVASAETLLRRTIEGTGDGKVPAGRYAPRALVPASVVEATGAFGPVLEAGLFPLLDGPTVADPDGDRVLLAVNLGEALDDAGPIRTLIRASSPDEETEQRRTAQRACSRIMRHALVTVAGHGTDGTERRPPGFLDNRLGPAAPVMGHLRSLLAALHLAGAPGVMEALPGGAECSRAVLDDFAASAVEHLLDTAAGREGPAAVARRIALGRLLERGGLAAVEREGRAALRVADEGKLRQTVAELLGEVRRIRYDGDGDAARALIDRHGGIPAAWAGTARALTAAMGGITTAAFVYPAPGTKGPPAGIVEARVDRVRRRERGQDIH